MTTLDVPFVFQVHGAQGRRVPRTLRVTGFLRHEVVELDRSARDGSLVVTEGGTRYEAPVFDGIPYLPVTSIADGRAVPAGIDPIKRTLALAAQDHDPGLKSFLGRREPFLAHGDPYHSGQSSRPGPPIDRRTVRETRPSSEDAERTRAEARAAGFRLIDGVPHTSRFEPTLRGLAGTWSWRMRDVVDDGSSYDLKAVRLAGSAASRLDVASMDSSLRVEGDLDAVAWRFDAEGSMLESVAHALHRLHQQVNYPIHWHAVGKATKRLEAAIEMRDMIPPQDWAEEVRRVADLHRSLHGEPERIRDLLETLDVMTEGLALRREAAEAVPADDVDAVMALG